MVTEWERWPPATCLMSSSLDIHVLRWKERCRTTKIERGEEKSFPWRWEKNSRWAPLNPLISSRRGWCLSTHFSCQLLPPVTHITFVPVVMETNPSYTLARDVARLTATCTGDVFVKRPLQWLNTVKAVGLCNTSSPSATFSGCLCVCVFMFSSRSGTWLEIKTELAERDGGREKKWRLWKRGADVLDRY